MITGENNIEDSGNIFSYSKLNTFKTCPQLYKIIYIDQVRKKEENIESFMGKRVHEALEWLYNDENISLSYITFDSLCNIYARYWNNKWHDKIYIVNQINDKGYYFNLGKLCLSKYYRRYGPTFNHPVKYVEHKLDFSIGKYNFRSVIDRIDIDGIGNFVIHDYKTGKSKKTYNQAVNDIQLGLYEIAVKQNFEEVKDVKLTWHFLRYGIEININRNIKQLTKIQNKIINSVNDIIDKQQYSNSLFVPKESLLCNWCHYWEECIAKNKKNPIQKAY